MSQLNLPLSYGQIEDQLDAIGQRWRIVQIVRGLVLWLSSAVISFVIATLAASFSGQGKITLAILAVWIAWIVFSAALWIGRPLLLRPRLAQIARLIEGRVTGLHNGLTNSVLLASATDLRASPFLPAIFDEVLASVQKQPLETAVRFSEIRPIALRVGGGAVAALLLAICVPSAFGHGFRQLFSPSAFVPTVSSAKIIDVRPGDVTLVTGQPLEIAVLAEDTHTNDAKLIFDDGSPAADLTAVATVGSSPTPSPTPADSAALPVSQGVTTANYTYRQDHVDRSVRYRVEVGGTQSPWYTVTVVKQVRLEQLSLAVTPPAYTLAKSPATTINLTPDTIAKTPVAVPLGSRISVVASIDVPCNGAMLQLADDSPLPMTATRNGKSFSGDLLLSHDAPLAILMTEGTGQVIARLPEDTLIIHATPDSPPIIQMTWPTQDTTITPDAPIKIRATLRDDYGLTAARVLYATSADAPLVQATQLKFPDGTTSADLNFDLPLKPEERAHGRSVRVQVEATDNRDLRGIPGLATNAGDDGGPQTSTSSVFEVRFRDPEVVAKEQKEAEDKLREILNQLLQKQTSLHDQTVTLKLDGTPAIAPIHDGQYALKSTIDQVTETFPFADADQIVQKTLEMISLNPAKDAIDLSAALGTEQVVTQRTHLSDELQSRQRRIISTLESLLSLLGTANEATTQPNSRGDLLLSKSDAYKKLDAELQAFMKEQQRILDQTAALAKKPVDRYDDNDKKKLDELAMAQEKLDAFMEQKLSDFAKLSEQDLSNASLLKDITQEYSEVTMAKDALKQKAVELAIPEEESGLEGAKEISSNIEKWLSNTPDRQQWNMEDPITKTDTPMPELPKELEDMIGDLLEQQEDLFDQMEDANANWADSIDKGVGWDAADGPIADMSAKGVTGNVLPNNNEMNGRSGEGRSGKSEGEFVGDTAVGKGGRNTPTRLDPTPFQKGQIKDTSKDPVGGATGGGKMSGEGGAGLEGPVPPEVQQAMQRLAQKQAEIRNSAERLNLQYKLGRYDNFKLMESSVMMRQVETDLEAGRYQNAMRRRDITLDALDTSHLLLGGEIHVEQDTTPSGNSKLQTDISDAMKGQLPAAWADALKEYYKKLGQD
jgi:lipoprotein-anchoring transpeptidase ErfK/SrfK